jgi:subtilisin family serine protease
MRRILVVVLVLIFSLTGLFSQETKMVNGYKVMHGERPAIDLSKVTPDLYEAGKIMIKLVPKMANLIKDDKIIDRVKGGYVRTGVQAIDEMNTKFKAEQYRPGLYGLYDVSPASEKFRDRHVAWGFNLWMEITLEDGVDVIQAVKEYQNLLEVQVAEPVYKKRLYSLDQKDTPKWTPNDSGYSDQWHYNNTGQTGGTADCDIDLPEAWEIEKGNSDVIVAVIDQGVQFNHPDLAANMWPAIGPDGTNTIVDYHGTHVGGTVAAVTNNGTGVAGVAGGSGSGDGVRIMTISLFNPQAITTVLGMFTYAADNGASITQNSWGYGGPDVYVQSEIDGIDYFNANGGGSALDGGITIFAAGNDNDDGNWWPGYYSEALSVAATSYDDDRAYYSNYGSWVHIAAPGGDAYDGTTGQIYSTYTTNKYDWLQGTSMACPHVSGVAALLVSKAYREGVVLKNTDVWNLLVDNTDNIEGLSPGFVGLLGSGRLNANSSLLALLSMLPGGTPPPTPTLISPADASSTSDATPTFDWSDASGATSYTILVDDASNFSSPVINQSPTSSTYTPGTDLATGVYYWKVLATNSDGSSSYSGVWDFTITPLVPMPALPTLISPANGSTVEDLTPTFDWSDAANATGYNIKICTNKQMSTIYIETTTTASEFTPPSDMLEDTYFWWVSSTNATGESATTGYWDVNVIAPPPPPGAPTLISPSNGSGTTDTTPSFDWSDVASALDYEILVDNNSDFSSPEINQTGLAVSGYTAVSALSNGTYYWKVRGINASGPGTYSASWNFSIGAAPGIPVLALPANASLTIDQTPTFDWNDVTDATSYTILVDNNSDFLSPEVDQSVAVSTYTPGTDLGTGIFYWKVLATNTYGSSAYSGFWTVDIGAAPGIPVLVSPSDGSITADYRPVFDWNNVTGADSYSILVDNDVNFGSPEIDQNPAVSTYTTPSDLAIGTYYWKVSATNAYGTGSYSGVWDFTTPVPDITLSTLSLNENAAPGAQVQDSFDIGNVGGIDLDYTISHDYITSGGNIDLMDNTFDSNLGWNVTGAIVWNWSNGGSNLDGTPFGEIIGTSSTDSGILTSPVFDGSTCESMVVEFDQNCIFSNPSSGSVEYTIDGSNWIQIYTNTGSLGDWGAPDHQSVNIPAFSSTMQVRFVGYLKKNSGSSWSIDNINIHGYSAGPSYTWLSIDSSTSGSVVSSGSNTINITCDASGLADGTYNAEITVDSNDPDEPAEIVAVEFIVFQSTIIPAVPANIVTSISGTDLVVDWDISADATGYDVYSSDDPYGTFIFAASVGTNQYTVAADQAKLFYYIVATNSTK